MVTIDKSKPVLVTGATGFVAGWLVKKLLDEGLTVNAAIRNTGNKQKLAHLNKLAEKSNGTINFFEADLLKDGSYAEAMKDCELVFHTASPFTSDVTDPQKELIDPAVKGTSNVLTQANNTSSVKRVVLTSSLAAIYTDASECTTAPNKILNEDIWNTTASLEYQPYYYSKTLAEKKAWEIQKNQSRWDLVTINPSLVIGPALNTNSVTSESYTILKQMGNGSFKTGVPKLAVGIVDVRDVAEAHFQAGFTPKAKGRYITHAYNTDIYNLSQLLVPKYGNLYPIPKRMVPKWLLIAIGPLVDKRFSRRFIRNNVDIEFNADNSKIKKELGIQFRPIKVSIEESFEFLIKNKFI